MVLTKINYIRFYLPKLIPCIYINHMPPSEPSSPPSLSLLPPPFTAIKKEELIEFKQLCWLTQNRQGTGKQKNWSSSLLFCCCPHNFQEEMGTKNGTTTTTKKNGSFFSIFSFASGVDKLLMTIGFLGSVGDGISMPAMLLLTSKLLNNVGGVGTSIHNMSHNLNKVSQSVRPRAIF